MERWHQSGKSGLIQDLCVWSGRLARVMRQAVLTDPYPCFQSSAPRGLWTSCVLLWS
ncbi:hypothetical protein AFA2_03305 [Alcaligenes faecalis subsp. faecalis NBRC 13111]|nr:hypothetical protein AFA2_03305 [Alcaligenes faecalis subsp. faecalis NBRC 13111]